MIKTIETRDGEVSTIGGREAGGWGRARRLSRCSGLWCSHDLAFHGASLLQVVSEATQQQHEVL